MKGALLCGALFCLCPCPALPAAPAGLCPPSSISETVQIRSVSDGDTLRLEDGRKLRLIGINTPELARDGRPAEPLAQEAKTRLSRLVRESSNRIGLQYGRERHDSYRRTLAHAFLADGRNLQAELLQAGLATAYTTPPNDSLSDCYSQAEQQALQAGLGLWARSEYQPKAVSQLDRNDQGFRRVRGRVSRISRNHEAGWLILDERLRVRIAANDLIYFDQAWLQQLTGQIIEIRGWLHPDNSGYFMQLRHPSAIRRPDSPNRP